ncbi:MAG: phosphatidylserine decarboxylase [Firmicutes bacterium]|nr:phosphatidylserine decarboxylase [Bacillota bacterium]
MFLAIFAFLAVITGGSLFYLYFHRIPQRISPQNPNAILAPADGKIWQILFLENKNEARIPKRFLGEIQTFLQDVENAGIILSIFMSPLDVHVNWSPVNGKILKIQHTPGKFAFANTWSSFSNEKNEILIQTDRYSLKMIQIAGFLARRIECWVKENQTIAIGEAIGMIRLGSQVSLVLPESVTLKIKPGDKVKGGETILGFIEPPAKTGTNS